MNVLFANDVLHLDDVALMQQSFFADEILVRQNKKSMTAVYRLKKFWAVIVSIKRRDNEISAGGG